MAAGVRGGQVSNAMRATVRCFGCGAEEPDIEGPTHRYMLSASATGSTIPGACRAGHRSSASPRTAPGAERSIEQRPSSVSPLVSLASHRGAPPSFPTVKQVQPEDAGQDVLRPGGASARSRKQLRPDANLAARGPKRYRQDLRDEELDQVENVKPPDKIG